MRSSLLASILLLAVLGAASDPALGAWSSNRVRNEPMTGSWLWLNLTWAAEGGRITVGDAPADPPTDPAPPAVQTFTSDPLPQAVYLDPSRLIRVEIATKAAGVTCGTSATSAKRLAVGLYHDGALAAGGFFSPYLGSGVDPPEGIGVCPYRIPIELAFVPQGGVVTFRLEFQGQPGVALAPPSEYPSTVVLPVFSPEEAVYRMPEVVPRLRDAQAGIGPQTGNALPELGAFALPLLFLVAPSRGGRRAAVVALLLLGVGAAGCLGAASKGAPSADPTAPGDEGGGAKIAYEDPWDEDLGNETVGSIVGRVSDRYGFPVAAAHVVLVGGINAQKTPDTGIFSFRDLKPGTYRLRVDRENYESLEVDVKVVGNKVSRVDVVLAYDSSLAAGERPHLHDYWEGENEAVLFTGPVFYGCGEDPRCKRLQGFYVEPTQGTDRKLIRPGTSEVEIVLTFTGEEACATKMGIAIQENKDAHPDNWTFFPPRAAGEPFHVRTTWENTDVGHQLFSTWTFAAFSDALSPAECPRQQSVGGIQDTLDSATKTSVVAIRDYQITIQRGALPLEPRHPDHWAGADRLVVLKEAKHKDPYIGYPDFATVFYAACLATENGVTLNSGSHVFLPELTSVVPAGTASIQILMNQSRSNGIAPQVPVWHWQLWYKSGETQVERYFGGTTAYRPAPEPQVSADGRRYEWTLSVKDLEADGLYNKKSAWRFVLAPDDPEARCTDMYLASMSPNVDGGAASLGPLELGLDIHALRGAAAAT